MTVDFLWKVFYFTTLTTNGSVTVTVNVNVNVTVYYDYLSYMRY
jgi:hypothetical protein